MSCEFSLNLLIWQVQQISKNLGKAQQQIIVDRPGRRIFPETSRGCPRSKIQPTDIYRHKLQLTEALFVNGTFPLTMFLRGPV